MASPNNPVIEAAVIKACLRLDLTKRGKSSYWSMHGSFDRTGANIIKQAMQAASLATTRERGELMDADASKAQWRVVEPTLRGLLNCAEQVGGGDFEIPMKLRKSIPSPSRMKSVYYPSLAFDVKRMLPYEVTNAYTAARANPSITAESIHGRSNEALSNMMRMSWVYQQARASATNKQWEYVLHEDLDHSEFETWRAIARQLNKNIKHMKNTRYGVRLRNEEVLAQILMGLAAQVYQYWRDLRNNKFLRE